MTRINRKHLRRLCQFAVLALFALVPWLHLKDIRLLTGNLLSFEIAGLPLADPLAALQALLSSRGGVAASLLLGAAITLLLALALGPVFCSWLCPYGLVADILGKLRKKRRPLPHRLTAKTLVFGALALIIGLAGLPPLLNQISLPGWYSRATQSLWLSGVIPTGFWLFPAAAVLDVAVGGRFWCRFCCPQSLLLVWAGRLSPKRLRVVHDPSRCSCSPRRPSPCVLSCPLDIDPRQRGVDPECTNCGDCVVACARFGQALSQRFASQQSNKETKGRPHADPDPI